MQKKWIDFPLSDDEGLYLTVLDDGDGMDDASLLNVMKYGSERDSYSDNAFCMEMNRVDFIEHLGDEGSERIYA